MFVKWVNYELTFGFTSGPACAPSISITFINMVLFKGIVPPKGCDEFMYSGQKGLQRLFVLALLCVPWILLAKPNVSIMRHRKAHQLPSRTCREWHGCGGGIDVRDSTLRTVKMGLPCHRAVKTTTWEKSSSIRASTRWSTC
ncbi:V-type proton ATPase 116 kDa subunit a 1-like [Schistocerca gregaria]|uniref:V-type proton ATPase 116 kDa subunit a 1-like n=1 Tax=Schistocerca gregaria TaxID=7010 RepID=UPI00211ECB16|nr:V-type proton ATPase 116 kDa subunit a 1-like [Schistocerca gregaria]